MQYVSQQLSPLVRRVHARVETHSERLPDPALGDWGRTQLAAEPTTVHASLEEAVAGAAAPVELLEVDAADGAVRQRVRLGAEEHLWGAYDSDASGFDRRGDHVHLVNEIHPRSRHLMAGRCDFCDSVDVGDPELEIGGDTSNYGELLLPFVISSAGWAVYVSNAHHQAVLDLGCREPDVLAFDAPGGEADVYVFGPGDPATLLAEFVRLTGHQPLPPAWTLGYLQSRFGYESFDHVHDVLARFEAERLPVHGVVFDVQWLEEHVNLRWDPVHFPDPRTNLARIAERGVRSIVITEPGTTGAASNHASGQAVDAFATDATGGELDSLQWYAHRGIEGYREIEPSTGALLNVFREAAADWWYEQHVELLDEGVDAWWLDLNEPEDVVADEVRFRDVDWPAARDELDGRTARNLYAIAQQRLFARRDRTRTTRRPFLLSRSGSAGSQRYGAAPWTGDVGATWEDLRVQPRLTLLAGMCGIPLHGSDIGGFNGDPGPELFVRWMQLGAMSPIFRAHGYMRDREPWSQGPEALEAIRPSLLLRAQLLPSVVSWAAHALRSGQPLARPMLLGPLGTQAGSEEAMAYASDARFADLDDQYFFGELLVAPVLEAGATSRRVELPAGTWVNVWTGTRHAGGGAVEVPVELGTLPLFVAPTTALLVDPEPLAGRGHAWPPPELEAWSWAGQGETATARLYLDDGITRMHEQGAYCLQGVRIVDGDVEAERLGGSWPASRIRSADPHPGTAIDVAAPGLQV